MKWFKKDSHKNYSSKEILKQLDICAKEYTFPMLDNGYIYPVHSKLSAYRDISRWAMVIEVFGFNYRGGGHHGIANCLHVFGNCLQTAPGTDNHNFLLLTGDVDGTPTFDENNELLNPQAKYIRLRDAKILINHDRNFYTKNGISLCENERITIWEFLRGLELDYSRKFEATDEELRERIPSDLPQTIQLREWHHPDLANSEMPSESETFQQIARVLETGNVKKYQPTLKANNHWKHWPEGGRL